MGDKGKQSFLQLFLSHHIDLSENTFCVREGRICICSRCCGLYLSFALFSLLFYLNRDLIYSTVSDYLIGYFSIAMGSLIWILEKLKFIKLSKVKKSLNGAILGIGASWLLILNLYFPFSIRVIDMLEWGAFWFALSLVALIYSMVR